MKKEKGSVTLFVLITCMFMIMILLIVNIGVMNKTTNQEKELDKIVKEYSVSETDLDNIYKKIEDNQRYVTAEEVEKMIKNNFLKIYPIGSIYITTNEQNPGEYLGGKWERYAEGKTIVGAGTGTDSNNVQKVFEINETGGEYEHTLTVNEMPNHYHQFYRQYVGSGYTDYNDRTLASNGQVSGGNPPNADTNAVGGNQPHNNIQPYIVTYIWKRVS